MREKFAGFFGREWGVVKFGGRVKMKSFHVLFLLFVRGRGCCCALVF